MHLGDGNDRACKNFSVFLNSDIKQLNICLEKTEDTYELQSFKQTQAFAVVVWL